MPKYLELEGTIEIDISSLLGKEPKKDNKTEEKPKEEEEDE